VHSEIDWFALALAQLQAERGYAPKVLAITGTNGKTTVTALTRHLAQAAGQDAVACGNISPAALDALQAALDAESLPQVWVLELSSFQLHYTSLLKTDAATVLNLSQDHLDWHTDMADYAAAKARIFKGTRVRVINRDDPLVAPMGAGATPDQVVSFGLGEPALPGDFGIQEAGLKWLVQAQPADDTPRKKKDTSPIEVIQNRMMPADALRIRGSHNHANALAALALLRAIDLPLAGLLKGLRDYAGEPHRCQFVASIDEVDYIDDSKGTNVGATQAAIAGLAEGRRRIHLIAGGLGKGQDFSPLIEPVTRYAKTVLLIGQDAPAIRAALAGGSAELLDCADLPAAVQAAAERAAPGDIVLLSPACASFDMFKGYAHRSEVFVQSVSTLQNERGLA
ncbi:MAG TPA: UDP-N-acetylmuramoyl-L-alanine--D-glutamate ligase, partial [Burkholderiaceae bacterium]|nr:UDP-N-acetylmuramoyl-L-alanine--D-glutamate ligase [Burkholderiaceae bacterium]